MENITTTPNQKIESLRKSVAESVVRQYGAERDYAKELNAMFGFAWYKVEANDIADNAKPVHAEKKALYAELKVAKHSNPSTIWARVRKLGLEEAQKGALFGEVMPVEKPKGEEGEEAQGSGNAHHARSPRTRNLEELASLYLFNARQDTLDADVKEAQKYIIQALKALNYKFDLAK